MNQSATPGVSARISSTLLDHLAGALLRRGVGQLHADEDVALVLVGRKPVGTRWYHQAVSADQRRRTASIIGATCRTRQRTIAGVDALDAAVDRG